MSSDFATPLSAEPPSRPKARNRGIWFIGILLLAALVLMTLGSTGFLSGLRKAVDWRNDFIESLINHLPWKATTGVPIRAWLRQIVLAPHFFAMMGLITMLEVLFPAKPRNAQSLIAITQDFFWYLLQAGLFMFAISWFWGVLGIVYRNWVPFLTTDLLVNSPLPVGFTIAFLVSDFLAWLNHYVRHKLRFCWWFHTIHHSQTQLNAMTDARYHLVEYAFASLIRFVPLYALQIDPAGITLFAFFSGWYTKFYHANIRSNLGILRYVLVTPQSHRIHHSTNPEHYDTNYGVILSIWDRLFGTQSPDDYSYPETGLTDQDVPLEKRWRTVVSFRTMLEQNFYPFAMLMRRAEKPLIPGSR